MECVAAEHVLHDRGRAAVEEVLHRLGSVCLDRVGERGFSGLVRRVDVGARGEERADEGLVARARGLMERRFSREVAGIDELVRVRLCVVGEQGIGRPRGRPADARMERGVPEEVARVDVGLFIAASGKKGLDRDPGVRLDGVEKRRLAVRVSRVRVSALIDDERDDRRELPLRGEVQRRVSRAIGALNYVRVEDPVLPAAHAGERGLKSRLARHVRGKHVRAVREEDFARGAVVVPDRDVERRVAVFIARVHVGLLSDKEADDGRVGMVHYRDVERRAPARVAGLNVRVDDDRLGHLEPGLQRLGERRGLLDVLRVYVGTEPHEEVRLGYLVPLDRERERGDAFLVALVRVCPGGNERADDFLAHSEACRDVERRLAVVILLIGVGARGEELSEDLGPRRDRHDEVERGIAG